MSRSLAFVVMLLLLEACATPTIPVRRGITTPHAIGVVCLGADGTPVALDDPTCVDDGMRALVSGLSSVGAAVPWERTWVDVDESTPGYTPLHMPDMPGAIAMDPLRGHGYVAIPVLGWIVRVDLAGLAGYRFSVVDWQDVGVSAHDLLVVQTPEPRLYMTEPATGTVWWLSLTNFAKTAGGKTLPPKAIAVGGTPSSLTWSSLSQRIYVGHLSSGFASVITPSFGSAHTVAQISLVAQCRNGLDDDGDGKIDSDDSGCDGPNDVLEGNPERGGLCGDLIDNDGDGQTDKGDPGCALPADPTPVLVDACRNGIDDDGDGLTDYAVAGGDPGCSSWGDNSEWSEQVRCTPGQIGCRLVAAGVLINPAANLCSDGFDNDGDGKTDSADADCSAAGNAVEGAPACANGIDDDGDGTTDLGDGDCYNRDSLAEISAATRLRTTVAATFDGRFVVVADRTRRAILIIDAQTDTLLQPVPGQESPYKRATRLDLRDGIPGLTLPDVPLSLAAGQIIETITTGDQSADKSKPVMAVGLAQVGVQFLQFYPTGDLSTVSVDIVQNASDVTPTLTAGRPLLLIPGAALDLPTTIPTRFAALGSSLSTDAAGNTVYYGLTPTTGYADQRAETWRFTREGLLPGAVGSHARLLGAHELHDPTADFCALGVLPGDILQVQVPAAATCQGGGTYNFAVTAVHADRLEFDVQSGALDVPVTFDNQLSYDPKARTPWTASLAACVADGGTWYKLRAGGWLVRGSRTGILSTRASVDGECAALSQADRDASRVQETVLQPGKSVADVPVCPYAGDTLDPAIWRITPFQSPAFSAILSPGCDSSTYDANGDRVINLVPSIRQAEWVYGVTSATLPRTTSAGANPVAMASGPRLNTLYVVDEGAGLLQFVRISDGVLLDTPLD